MKVRCDMVTVLVARPTADRGGHEFLQLLRADGRYMSGTWQAVRGTANPQEPAAEAALRELREETGLAPAEFYRLPSLESFYTLPDDTIWHSPAFAALLDRDARIVLNEEHTDHRWVPSARIDEAFMWPGERALLRELQWEILRDGLAKPHLRIPLP